MPFHDTDKIAIDVRDANLVIGGEIDINIKNKGLVRAQTIVRCGFNLGLEARIQHSNVFPIFWFFFFFFFFFWFFFFFFFFFFWW